MVLTVCRETRRLTRHRRRTDGQYASDVMNPVATVFASRELLWSLTQRELRTKYRRSFLGWAWSMLNPLANVAIYGFVFGVLLGGSAPVGKSSGLENFALYLLCGLLPWSFFSLVNSMGMSSMSANSGLVRRVAFPREVLVFSNVAHGMVQFLIELSLLSIVLLIAGNMVLPWLIPLLGLVLLLAVFSAGFALALSTLSVYFRDLGHLWAIVMQVWFFVTPIVYSPDLIQSELPNWAQYPMRFNPMHQFVQAFRSVLYDTTWPGRGRSLVLVLSAGLSISIGWFIFARLGRRLPEEV